MRCDRLLVPAPVMVLAIALRVPAGPCIVTPPVPPSVWSNAITFPSEPFAVDGSGGDLPAWIKFTILACDPNTVYFQNSNVYAFHYDFATAHLDPLIGLSPAQFDALTLHASAQQAFLGAVLIPGWDPGSPPPGGYPQEYGIQLVRLDPYEPQEIVDLFAMVSAAVGAAAGVQPLYFPTYEQAQVAELSRDFLAANGVIVASSARWAATNPVYAEGWAIGDLVFVPGDQIEDAYIAGMLGPEDVLLTDGVPASMPYVSGVIALEPSTPNSHVAILAEVFDVPFVHLSRPADAAAAQALVGSRVVLRAARGAAGNDVTLIDGSGLDQATVDLLVALHAPPPITVPPIAPYGSVSANVESLELSDIEHFGGKAVNYRLIREAIPDHSRVATAFSFDLWTAFLDQTIAGGTTLRAAIAARLAGHVWPPSDLQDLFDDLDDVRDLFTDDDVTSFSPALQAAVIATLQDPQYGFDPLQNIRFRSSTNVEDNEFSGAGLYESRSGCLADDLDGDTAGPSICDPTETGERGVFRAIRRVFASFYNDTAYMERLRHGVDESEVGMAMLVHHSFPDPTEMANGVATYTYDFGELSALLVSQTGASPVTNPDPGILPEVVSLPGVFEFWQQPEFVAWSNLLLLGETVLDHPSEYMTLIGYLDAVAAEWTQATGVRNEFTLDFEYKKIVPGDLFVTQVRQVPESPDALTMTPFLIDHPTEYEPYQGQSGGSVLGLHRLKSRLTLHTVNGWLDAATLSSGLYTTARFEHIAECDDRVLAGDLSAFPGAAHEWSGSQTIDEWQVANLENPRTYELLTAGLDALVPPSSPIVIQSDLGGGGRTLTVHHANPVFVIDDWGTSYVTEESVVLIPRPLPDALDQRQERTMVGAGATILTSFYWPPTPGGFTAGYTAPCKAFDETTIEGLTSEPIVLQSAWSQTYLPGHHNFHERFVFDPFADSGVTGVQRAELEAQSIRLVYVLWDSSGAVEILLLSSDDLSKPAEVCQPCPGDVDDTGAIGFSDLVQTLIHWGDCGAEPALCPWDVNRDRSVGFADLTALLIAWGSCRV